ncbi:cytochrome c biogenesis protein CcsA [Campylobacter sp. RM9328]|uniref:cytochrome c biogenesis protein CcsA n=1 Tax=Campylobacter sp. RM9328 TaxID=1705720 RepID=UPI00147575B4|nr:cytochrome c biogenesis protein CcsA [Campylobacter sp. RM9328]
MRLFGFFSSYKFVIFMLSILATGAGVATFLESIYDTQTAKILVYDARWYEIVMLLLTISLGAIIIKTKMWRRLGAFVVHFAFIVIALGAFLTRYCGEEGVLHVREGEHSNEMVSVKPYLQIITEDKTFEFFLNLSQLGDNSFSISQAIDDKIFNVNFSSYQAFPKGKRSVLNVKAGFDDKEQKEVSLRGGVGWLGEPQVIEQDGKQIMLAWGSKLVTLPFSVKLNDFELERYPGSQSASSYSSSVEVLQDDKKVMDYKIFMNSPLNFSGYKLFQSSYDKDEQGTVLEVNKDPGKIPTYVGYFLLCFGFVANFFTKNSRFMKLAKFIKNNATLFIFALVFATNSNLYANDDLKQFGKFTRSHANGVFAELLVQDFMGRIKPMSTEANEIVSKFAGQNSLFGLSAEQIILGMSINPTLWQDLKIIKIKNSDIKKVLNLNESENFVSFSFMFDEKGEYKLMSQSDEANAKPASQRSKFDNEMVKFDERINVAYLALKGVFFKFIPIPNDQSDRWLSPNDAFANPGVAKEVKMLLNDYISSLGEGIYKNDWTKANFALSQLKNYQREVSAHILPSEFQIKAEVAYNKLEIFKKLVYFYMVFGGILLILALSEILTGGNYKGIKKISFWLFVFGFAAHTFGLALRWYIAGHAPWSDSYESMIYIGWSAALAGVVFFRSSLLTLCAASLLASVVMLVAHMSFVNPQITNLVPVLKSYWLSIHVSIITASYGFLGLGCLLGILALVLMILKNGKNKERLNDQIRYITAINEISLIVGLSMLTVGNFFGGIWANESWGRYWGWDSKETWSFVSIVVYAIVLHLRFIPKFNNIYTFCVSSMISYASIVMTYFGVNFYLTGMHSYASGDAMGVPKFIYFILTFVILLAVFAYRGREVKAI